MNEGRSRAETTDPQQNAQNGTLLDAGAALNAAVRDLADALAAPLLPLVEWLAKVLDRRRG